MMVEPSHGSKSVRSGRVAESKVDAIFKEHKVNIADDQREFHYEGDLWGRRDKLLVRQYRENGHKIDRVYINFESGLRLPIEIKNQMGGGTADEKLAYCVTVLERLGELNYSHFWLVICGQGYRPEVTKVVDDAVRKITSRGKIRGRIVWEPFLQRAVGELVDRGKT